MSLRNGFVVIRVQSLVTNRVCLRHRPDFQQMGERETLFPSDFARWGAVDASMPAEDVRPNKPDFVLS